MKLPSLQIPYTEKQLAAYVDAHVKHCEKQAHFRVLNGMAELLTGMGVTSTFIPSENNVGDLWLKVVEGTCTWRFTGNDESSTLFLTYEDPKKGWKRNEIDGDHLRRVCEVIVRENRNARRASYKNTNALIDLLSTRPKKSFARIITQSTIA